MIIYYCNIITVLRQEAKKFRAEVMNSLFGDAVNADFRSIPAKSWDIYDRITIE